MIFSLKSKFVLFNFIIAFMALFSFFVIIYVSYSNKLIRDIDVGLNHNAQILKRVLKFNVNHQLDLYKQTDQNLLSYNGAPLEYIVWDQSGRPLRRSVNMMFIEPNFSNIKNSNNYIFFSGNQYRFKIEEYTKFFANEKITLVLQLIHPMEAYRENMNQLLSIMLLLLPFPFLLILFGSWWIAQNNLGPLDKLIEEMNATNANNLNQELPIRKLDEIGRLTQAYNQLLGRLTSAFDALRRFTSDASHELRTPIMSIKSQGEIILGQHRAKEEYVDAIGSMLEDTQKLENLCTTLLQLARSDADVVDYQFERVNISQLIQYWIEHLSPLAEEKDIEIRNNITPNIFYDIDKSLFERIPINLLENAINYSDKGGHIEVSLYKKDGNIFFSVDDTGYGIPKESRKLIFQRFVRLDTTRRMSAGSGLGLAISDWAAKVHGGKIMVEENQHQGSRFSLILNNSSESLH